MDMNDDAISGALGRVVLGLIIISIPLLLLILNDKDVEQGLKYSEIRTSIIEHKEVEGKDISFLNNNYYITIEGIRYKVSEEDWKIINTGEEVSYKKYGDEIQVVH